jgi:hypothetical protein
VRIDFVILFCFLKSVYGRKIDFVFLVLNKEITSWMSTLIVV